VGPPFAGEMVQTPWAGYGSEGVFHRGGAQPPRDRPTEGIKKRAVAPAEGGMAVFKPFRKGLGSSRRDGYASRGRSQRPTLPFSRAERAGRGFTE